MSLKDFTHDIPRSIMPQVYESDLPELIDWLRSEGVVVEFTKASPAELRTNQDAIDPKMANAMPEAVMEKPALVALDGFIIDGNTRWLAHQLKGRPEMPVIRVGMDFLAAIAKICTFSKTFYYGDGKEHPNTN